MTRTRPGQVKIAMTRGLVFYTLRRHVTLVVGTPFAVHPRYYHDRSVCAWAVTHVPTGWNIGHYRETRGEAIAVAATLWHRFPEVFHECTVDAVERAAAQVGSKVRETAATTKAPLRRAR